MITVRQLKRRLDSLDDELVVVIPGGYGGVHYIKDVRIVSLLLNENVDRDGEPLILYGPHEAAETIEDGDLRAALIDHELE